MSEKHCIYEFRSAGYSAVRCRGLVAGHTLAIILFMLLVWSCCSSGIDDSDYFYGEIRRVKVPPAHNLNMQLNRSNNLYYTPFIVVDSILINWLGSDATHNYSIYDLRTDFSVGKFVSRGRADNEAIATAPLYGIHKNAKGDILTVIYAPNEQKRLIWNISESVLQNRTVADGVYRFKDNDVPYYLDCYLLDDTVAVMYAPSVAVTISADRFSIPDFRIVSLPDNRIIEKYQLFPRIIDGKGLNPQIGTGSFFRTCNALKPDGTKIALAMNHLPQINILDLQTGLQKYFRFEDGPGCEVFTSGRPLESYYGQTVCDDDYIYAMFFGDVKAPTPDDMDAKISNLPHLVHVYDWDGNLVKVFDLGQRVNSISVSDGVLWAVNYYTEELWSCDISDKL